MSDMDCCVTHKISLHLALQPTMLFESEGYVQQGRLSYPEATTDKMLGGQVGWTAAKTAG